MHKYLLILLVVVSLGVISWYGTGEETKKEIAQYFSSVSEKKVDQLSDTLKEKIDLENPKEKRGIIIQELKARAESLRYLAAVERGEITEQELEDFLFETIEDEEAERIMDVVRNETLDDASQVIEGLIAELETLNEKDSIQYELAEKAIDNLLSKDGVTEDGEIDCEKMCPNIAP